MERIKFVVFICIVVGLFSWFVFYLWNCILDCSVVGRVSVYFVFGVSRVPRSIFQR